MNSHSKSQRIAFIALLAAAIVLIAGGIFGVCMLGYMLICTIISPRISSALVASTGDYTASMIFAIIACVAAVAVYTTIPMPKRRTLAEVEAEEASKA